jgi:hypothetical protein
VSRTAKREACAARERDALALSIAALEAANHELRLTQDPLYAQEVAAGQARAKIRAVKAEIDRIWR